MAEGSVEEELGRPWVYTVGPSPQRMEVPCKEGLMQAHSGKSNSTLKNTEWRRGGGQRWPTWQSCVAAEGSLLDSSSLSVCVFNFYFFNYSSEDQAQVPLLP